MKHIQKYLSLSALGALLFVYATYFINPVKWMNFSAVLFYLICSMVICRMFVVLHENYLKRMQDKTKANTFTFTDQLHVSFRIGVPHYTYAGIAEELIFRFPLLMLYDSFSVSNWKGILISSLLFGAAHWGGLKYNYEEIKHYANSNGITEKSAEIVMQKFKSRKIIHVSVAFILGIGFSYLCLESQSIFWPSLTHMLYNFLQPPAIARLILAIIGSVCYVIYDALWNDFLKYKWRNVIRYFR